MPTRRAAILLLLWRTSASVTILGNAHARGAGPVAGALLTRIDLPAALATAAIEAPAATPTGRCGGASSYADPIRAALPLITGVAARAAVCCVGGGVEALPAAECQAVLAGNRTTRLVFPCPLARRNALRAALASTLYTRARERISSQGHPWNGGQGAAHQGSAEHQQRLAPGDGATGHPFSQSVSSVIGYLPSHRNQHHDALHKHTHLSLVVQRKKGVRPPPRLAITPQVSRREHGMAIGQVAIPSSELLRTPYTRSSGVRS
jgi:hypothetical protein